MYAGMMEARVVVIRAESIRLMQAVTVAARYSYQRKQFTDSEGQELPIIKY